MSSNRIVLDRRVSAAFEPDDPGYISNTKHRYQSYRHATRYLRAYAKPFHRRNWYAALIARRERFCVRQALRDSAGISTVLDLPAGTGKLAPIHKEFGYSVIAADVSAQMLEVGLRAAQWDGVNLTGLIQTDITDTNFRDGVVDCVICLRLMHRLPEEIVHAGLKEISRIASRWLIVSNGIDRWSLAHICRRQRGGVRARCGSDRWNRILSEYGHIESEYPVLPRISSEVITLLRLK